MQNTMALQFSVKCKVFALLRSSMANLMMVFCRHKRISSMALVLLPVLLTLLIGSSSIFSQTHHYEFVVLSKVGLDYAFYLSFKQWFMYLIYNICILVVVTMFSKVYPLANKSKNHLNCRILQSAIQT